MNLKGIADRVGHGELGYVLGRFMTGRAVYSGMRRILDPPRKALSHDELYANTLFPDADIVSIVQAIREDVFANDYQNCKP